MTIVYLALQIMSTSIFDSLQYARFAESEVTQFILTFWSFLFAA